VTVAVGPEGGFTEEEVALGQAAGWEVLDLGPRILRVETAALALAVLLGTAALGG
jgi:16S rRNA (uracil1498-N3)-methyltransferase